MRRIAKFSCTQFGNFKGKTSQICETDEVSGVFLNDFTMKKKVSFCFFLFLGIVSQAQTLTDSIYQAVDSLAANPLLEVLVKLDEREPVFLEKAQTNPEHLALLVLQCNMGFFYRKLGARQQAIVYYEKAWQNHEENQLSGYDIIEYCLKPLGNLYTVNGNFTQAENTIKSYIFLAEKQGKLEQKTSGILNLSVVYHNTGNFQMAVEILENALQTSNLNPEIKSKLENNLATNLFALKKIDQAKELLKNTAENQTKTSLEYQNLAQIALAEKDFQAAEKYLELAETSLKKKKFTARKLAKLYVAKAAIASSQKNNSKAEKQLSKALAFLLPNSNSKPFPKKERLYAENTFLSIFDALAALQSDGEKALEWYDLSFYVASLIDGQITSQQAKILHQIDKRLRSEKCLELLFEAYKKSKNKKFMVRAFQYAEHSKASVLKDVIARKTLLERFPEDSQLQKRQKLAQEQAGTIDQLVRAQLSNKQAEIPVLTDHLNAVYLKQQALQRGIEKKYPSSDFSKISILGLQRKLKEDKATMLLYFLGEENGYSFVFSGETLRWEQIPVFDKFKGLLKRFLSFFETPSAINDNLLAFAETSAGLFKKLNLKSLPKSDNLIIVPDGLLSFVPFGALLTQKTGHNNYADMPFLIRERNLAYNTSAGFYIFGETGSYTQKLLGVFPVFENSEYPLRCSEEEAQAIAKTMDATLLVREEATKENFLEMAGNYSVLHLSTHASGGNFTVPASLEFYDETLFVHELYSLDLNPDLVVLSACETGVGKIFQGEGAMSIARGFHYAGAENLLFSLWRVNDRSTARLMGLFYEHYSKTQSAFLANRQSKLTYLKNPNLTNAQKSPYYWAGFVYYGTIEVPAEIGLLTINGDTQSFWFWILGASALLIFAYFLFRKR